MLEVKNIVNFSKKDLKDVYVDENLIVTVGRDENVYITDLNNNNSITKLCPNAGNVNSVTYSKGKIICGTQTGHICIYDLETNMRSNLLGHNNNVCALEVRNDILLSGSWDHTLKVWNITDLCMIDSIEHPGTVWCVDFIDDNTFATGCADKTLRIFQNNTLVSSHGLHNFCIRGLTVVDGLIYSIDNEGTLLKTTVDGKLVSHLSFKDFMFSVCRFGDKLVCCGENGKIFLLNNDFNIIDETTAPCMSCWKSYCFGGNVYVCGSDGSLYIFSVKGIDNSMKKPEIYKQNEKTRTQPSTPFSNPSREFVSGDERFKVDGDHVYQLINGDWILLGEKQEQTENFDYSFKVELGDKFYTLSFNKKDNVYQVADEFLLKNKLSDEYRDQIVDYIRRNFDTKGDYKSYNSINEDGVRKLLSGYGELPFIFSSLNKPKKFHEKNIEKELNFILDNGPRFVALDLYRFFIIHGLSFDLAFLFRFRCNDRKEAVAFVRLLTVLYIDLPFNIESFYPVVQKLRDNGLLSIDDLDDYYYNRSISNKSV